MDESRDFIQITIQHWMPQLPLSLWWCSLTTQLSILLLPSSTYYSAETKQVPITWWLWCREARLGWSYCPSSPPLLLPVSLLWSFILGQWLLLIRVWYLAVTSFTFIFSALFQPITSCVKDGTSAWLPRVLLHVFNRAFNSRPSVFHPCLLDNRLYLLSHKMSVLVLKFSFKILQASHNG